MFINISITFLAMFVFFVPIIPPKLIFDIDYYFDQSGNKIYRQRQPIARFLIKQILGLVQQFVVDIAVALTLRGAITILIFLVVGFDLIYKHGLTSYSVTITIIGVITLYMEQLVQNASEIDFKIFKYKSK